MRRGQREVKILLSGVLCVLLLVQCAAALRRSRAPPLGPGRLEAQAVRGLDVALVSGDRSQLPTVLQELTAAEGSYTEPNDRYRVRCFSYLTLELLGDHARALTLFPRWQDRAGMDVSFQRSDAERLDVLRALRTEDSRETHWTTDRYLAETQIVNWGGLSEYSARHHESLVQTLSERKLLWTGACVAEVGAGVGGLTLAMAQDVGAGGSLHSNELNPGSCRAIAALARAGAAAIPSLAPVHVVQATAEKPGFPRAGLDLIVLENTFHAMLDPHQTWLEEDDKVRAHLVPYLLELKTSLKTDGVVAIIDFAPDPARIGEIMALAGMTCLSTESLGGRETLQVFAPTP